MVKKLIEKIRDNLHTKIILGGPHISCDPEITSFLGADYGLAGENEYSLLQVVKGETPTGFPIQENLDELPYPARHLLSNKKYSNPINCLTTTSFLTTRGCPYDCLFCSRASRGKKYNVRSIDNVIGEIVECLGKYQIKYITFMDETFTYDYQRTEKFCETILKEKIKFLWACQSRVNLLDKNLLKKMKMAGCINFSFGVESASEKTRKILGKPTDIIDYKNLVRQAKEVGIETNAYYMFGLPSETKQDILATMKFALELNTDYASFNITAVFPASNLYNQLIKEGKINKDIWKDYTLSLIDIPSYLPQGIKKEELEKQIGVAFKSFYFRPIYIWKRLLKIRRLSDVLHHLKILKILLLDYILKPTTPTASRS